MRDFFLKFATEADAVALKEALYVQSPGPDGPIYTPPPQVFVDTIGVIYKPSGKFDTNGMPILEPTPGWHVNVRVLDDTMEIPPEFAKQCIRPLTPVREWA